MLFALPWVPGFPRHASAAATLLALCIMYTRAEKSADVNSGNAIDWPPPDDGMGRSAMRSAAGMNGRSCD
jgi:hypothetical protein